MIRIKYCLGVAVTLVLSTGLFFTYHALAEALSDETVTSSTTVPAHQHDVVIRYQDVPKHDKITFDPLSNTQDIQQAVSILQEVLAVYPNNIGRLLNMPYINLVDNLSAKNSVYLNGIALSKYEENNLILNRLYLRYPTSGEPRNVYHHEIFHAIEAAYPVNEKTWAQFAPAKQYGLSAKDYVTANDKRAYVVRKNGYFSAYSYLSASEDRAEIFAHLMYPQTNDIYAQAIFSNDKLLQQKADFILGYMQAIFEEHQDSNRILHQLAQGYANLYNQPYFAARSIHHIQSNVTVYTQYNASGRSIPLYAGDYVYILEELKNPKNTYLALDKNANLVYVPKKFTQKIDTIKIIPLIDELKKQNITVHYTSHSSQITGKSILKNKKALSRDDSRLLYVTLNLIKNLKSADSGFPVSRIVLLQDMQYQQQPVSSVFLDGTLSIDIHHASEQDILNALKN